VDREYTQEGVDAQVVAALLEAERALADLGGEIREVRFPSSHGLSRSRRLSPLSGSDSTYRLVQISGTGSRWRRL
jgi:Asp-tRNA(Asn)/Glu-tRNA(Gln) amidotransferase A subunit family amidase